MSASVTSRIAVDVLDRRLRLDLRDDRHDAIAHQRPELVHVVGAPHERLRDEVDPEVEGSRESLSVTLGHGGQTQPLGGHVHALARSHDATAHALGPNGASVDRRRPTARRRRRRAAPGRPGPQVVGEIRVGRRGASVVAAPARAQVERPAPAQKRNGSGSIAPSRTLGPGRSASTASARSPSASASRTRRDRARVVVGRAVGEVDAEDRRAGRDEPPHERGRVRGRAEGADELRPRAGRAGRAHAGTGRRSGRSKRGRHAGAALAPRRARARPRGSHRAPRHPPSRRSRRSRPAAPPGPTRSRRRRSRPSARRRRRGRARAARLPRRGRRRW